MAQDSHETRRLKVAVHNLQPKIISKSLAQIKTYMKELSEIDYHPIASVEEVGGQSFDLLIILGNRLTQDNFESWLTGFMKRMESPDRIWVPALIITDVSFPIQRDLLLKSLGSNWYFDVISDDHLSSLPLRVSNLVRIHDHLGELHRYNEKLTDLMSQVDLLQEELSKR